MQLSPQLIVAVRARFKALRQEVAAQKVNRHEQSRRAIRDLLARKPRILARLKRAASIIRAAEAASTKARQTFDGHGLNTRLDYITDERRFIRLGGVMPLQSTAPSHVEIVLSDLARATPNEGAAILKRLGINWEA